ncbi:MAG: LysM peptidoglycan-binding domain-containing protein [Bacteriovoracaceae bacterium]|nr:LysM peptidoglycan-binding domain-containing protein [Bacteriovoracaceae bacterium]
MYRGRKNLALMAIFGATLLWCVPVSAELSVVSKNEAAPKEKTHTVARGESLMSISNEYYGTHQKWREISAANPEIDPDALTAGTELRIPPLKVVNGSSSNHSRSVANTGSSSPSRKRYKRRHSDPIKTALQEVTSRLKNLEKEEKRAAQEIINQKKAEAAKKVAEANKLERLKRLEEARKIAEAQKIEKEKIAELKKAERLKRLEEARKLATAKKLEKKRIADNKRFERQLTQKYKELEKEYVILKDQELNLREEIISLRGKEKKLVRSDENLTTCNSQIRNLNERNKELTLKSQKLSNKNREFLDKHPYQMPGILSYSQDQILKEKNRILTQRMWIEKNKSLDKCMINLLSPSWVEEDRKVSFKKLAIFLNRTYGSDNLFIDQSNNSILINLPANSVYGSEKPKLSNVQKSNFETIGYFLGKLPLTRLHISGASQYGKVFGENGSVIPGNEFILKQTMKIEDFFVGHVGIKPSIVSTGAMSALISKKAGVKKKFTLEINLQSLPSSDSEKPEDHGRKLASVISKDKSLDTVVDEIKSNLGEPSHLAVEVSGHDLEIHLGAHYIFNGKSTKLSLQGQDYIHKVLDMFSLSSDVRFQILYVPGKLHTTNYKNKYFAVKAMNSIKEYTNDKISWSKGRIEYGFANRFHSRVPASTETQDLKNHRIIIRIIPLSIGLRKLGEMKEGWAQ